MTITYKNTKRDLYNFSFICLWNKIIYFIILDFIFASVASWPALAIFYYSIRFNLKQTSLAVIHFSATFLLMAIIVIIYLPAISLYLNTKKNNPSFYETCKMTISDDYLYVESAKYHSKRSWSLFINVIFTRNYIVLYQNKLLAHIVPKRAFVSDSDFNEFSDRVKECFHNSRN